MPIELDNSRYTEMQLELMRKDIETLGRLNNDLKIIEKNWQDPAPDVSFGIFGHHVRTNPQINAKDFTARLPQELASNVMASLNCPADRLMLALTCKHWASTFEHVKAFSPGMPFTTLEVVRTKAGKNTKTSRGGNATSSTRIKSNKPKQTDQLKVFLRLDRWINPRYRPCYVCMKYFRRDVKQSEKLKVRGIQTFFMSGKVHGPNDAFSAKGGPSMKKVQDNGPRCPDCSARRQIRVVRESIEYGKLLRQARTLSK